MNMTFGKNFPPYHSFLRGKRIVTPMWAHHLPTITPAEADAINNKIPVKSGSVGGNKPMGKIMAKNLGELRKENPELAATIEAEVRAAVKQSAINAVVAAERKRLQEIEDIAEAINDDELVFEAKYGEEACTAQELALRAAINAGVKAAQKPKIAFNRD